MTGGRRGTLIGTLHSLVCPTPRLQVVMDAMERQPESAAALFREALVEDSAEPASTSPPAYNCLALQGWLLECCQVPGRGGMRDKPGKNCDFYHTCYCLSGLSMSQQYGGVNLGSESSLLQPADPAVNVVRTKLQLASEYWGAHPL